MWKHVTDAHSDSDPKGVEFGMTVLHSHLSPFHRQVTESVLIYRNQDNLNSKSMYDRRVAASKLDSVGVRKLHKYFIKTGKKDDATQKVLSDDS